MTLASTPPLIDYVEDGVTLVHAIPFQFQQASDIVCSRIIAGVETVLTNGSAFTVTGGNGSGGSVTKASAGVAGNTFRVRRVTLPAQTTSFATTGAFPAANVEKALDRDMAIDQETAVSLSLLEARTVHGGSGDTIAALPASGQRASKFMQWAGDGKSLLMLAAADVAQLLAAPIAALMGAVAKGDPGGNVRSVGQFIAIPNLTIPDGTGIISTSGYSKDGVGNADYAVDPAVDAAYVAAHPRTSAISLNGKGVRLVATYGHWNVKWFGAQGDSDATGAPGTDDTIAIQAAIDFINTQGGGILFFPAGYYKITAVLTACKFLTLLGCGNNSSVIVGTHAGGGGANAGENLRNGSAIASVSPVNGSTITRLRVDALGIKNTNAANIGAAIYDLAGSEIAFTNCGFGGFKYGVVLDQSELVDIDLCSFASQNANGAGLWIVNGADLTPGAGAGFTNRISWRRCQFNEGATAIGVQDDGGSAHSDIDNNFNGGLHHRRICGVFPLNISGGEHESAADDMNIMTSLKPSGSSVGGALVSIRGGLYSAPSGKASVAGQSGAAGFLEVSGIPEFSGGAGINAITGSTFFAAIVLISYSLNTAAPTPKDGEAQFIDVDINIGGGMLFAGTFSFGGMAITSGVPNAASYKSGGVQVVGAQQAAIANDASGAANQATVNAILTALRTHGLIHA